MSGPLVAAVAGSIGLALGALLDVLTVLMAAAGPAGDGWSFRGNGALVVPLGLGCALLSSGWAALSLYARGTSVWAPFGVLIGVAAAVPAALSVIVLAVFGRAAQPFSDLMTVPALSGPLLTFAGVMLADRQGPRSRRLSRACALAAAAIFAGALGAGFFGAELLLAPGAAS